MGRIFLNGLKFSALIGTLPHERLHRQMITVDLEIKTDMRHAAVSDDLCDAVDYSDLEKKVAELVENSSFKLLEALAGAIGNLITAAEGVEYCRVRIDKPQATQFGTSVAVEMEFDGKGAIQ